MLSEDLLRQVRLIELSTRKIVSDVVTGNYKSHFKGQGVQFSEHRPYIAGDDIRHIDWKASARTREPLIKKYEEERELTVFIVVDISGSEVFGSTQKLKSEVVAEIGGMLAYAASHTGDKVGVLLFSDEVELIIPPGKGRHHVLRVVKDLLAHVPQHHGTRLSVALEAAGRIMKHSGIIFVMSDFLAKDYDHQLRRLARKHDVVAISIQDQRELEIPEVGYLLLHDPETQEEQLVDTSSYAFKKWFEEFKKEMNDNTRLALKGGIQTLKIKTQENYGEAVVRFFHTRARSVAKRAAR